MKKKYDHYLITPGKVPFSASIGSWVWWWARGYLTLLLLNFFEPSSLLAYFYSFTCNCVGILSYHTMSLIMKLMDLQEPLSIETWGHNKGGCHSGDWNQLLVPSSSATTEDLVLLLLLLKLWTWSTIRETIIAVKWREQCYFCLSLAHSWRWKGEFGNRDSSQTHS